MSRHLYLLVCFLCFSFALFAQEEATEGQNYSVLSSDVLSEDIGLIPESLDANVDSLLQSWHVRYFSKTDGYCHDDEKNVYFSDEVIRERLERLPRIIPMTYNNIVRNSINLYTERRRSLIRYMLGMADFYFPMIEQILDENGLPMELKYLAVVESALNPTALSRVGAAGLWQFMLPTGKSYGLEINSLVDDRRDPVKATQAACRYFKDMYEIYQDWHLVLAAYNCGPGNVNKAIRRSGGKMDFWQIFQHLPRETRSYVPLFIAANYAMNYYCDHNICPVETTLPLSTDTVMVNRAVHLQQVADLVQMDVEEIRALNPQYKRDIIPGNVKPSVLKLPTSKSFAYIEKENAIYGHRVDELLGMFDENGQANASNREQIIHVTKAGETLFTIGDKYGVTARDIRKWNGLGSNRVASGKRLKLYVDNGGVAFASNKAKQETTATATATKTTAASQQVKTQTAKATTAKTQTASAANNKGYVTYKVKSGDSLYSIARKYPGVSAAVLQKANNLPNSNIRPGQILKVPTG
ncbi:membrane-bound lytic murein transglycosylase D [Parabacteroides sp. PF5-5]|uniref:lytic transglycosylase domain-containing protein n=1 Tax=unclassified Parabacteroides TaxID=2649774 RepID=UPI002473A4A6|nr:MULTISPECIES: lytic transglycosylase domain-containing protein [unclassified Parabacteroides]MDH6306426.1 membrane-bound lytic murein transglycosylase D [Parabacteroides sp. PH5-39]MDH6317422.1 membrane-bound lytic murein transglycosylase D [Parabacteroides sp. PF5-13]MDH6321137.1 membrane-bound lytic murein transglycosylase D [Parabacteroides sp. PH5-13]MDH6324869.1 membrane-bound lytic murein transglycosylase D [Parabacteroides sp. PH5-8]MDH6328607.1 membrane-bound lytic murein transglyco